jgi:hypothetical protein
MQCSGHANNVQRATCNKGGRAVVVLVVVLVVIC